ncbi:hypothetical protein QUB47_22915 [Microcoleus sp. AT9_B5]
MLSLTPWSEVWTNYLVLGSFVHTFRSGKARGYLSGARPSKRKLDWSQHWFCLTCGPTRLVKGGKVWLSPVSEGFKYSHVVGVGSRTAIGFPASRDKLFLVTFFDSLALEAEAKVLQAMRLALARATAVLKR